jgi:GTP cyclohydrolase III
MAKKAKLPADTNKRAKSIVDMATGEIETPLDPIKAAAAALGRKGGLKGGKARAEALTPEKRAEIAKKAAAARWKNK